MQELAPKNSIQSKSKMVFFALTRSGFIDFKNLKKTGSSLWVLKGVLSQIELRELRNEGISVTEFNHSIAPEDQAAISIAIKTIGDHHPDETVWVGYPQDNE